MSNTNENTHKKIGFSDCMGLAVGQIIGSGIMAVSYTHLSVISACWCTL